MRRRLFNLLAAVSLVLCAASVLVWVASYRFELCLRYSWRLGETSALSYEGGAGDGQFRVVRTRTPYPRNEWGWQGVAYRKSQPWKAPWFREFRFLSVTRELKPGYEAASAFIPCWFAGALFAILPTRGAWLMYLVRMRNQLIKAGRCTVCNYDLRASKDRCPECGTAIGAAAEQSRGTMPA
jgi:predicted RNA-binding Zn-ribbon protein involved in translation (DUF1610 family)